MEIIERLKRDRDTRKKFLYTVGILYLLLIGYRIPLPGINPTYISAIFSNMGGGFLNAITGSSFSNMSIFALSITPYITASILLQLLTVIIPKLQELSKSGSVGKQKMERLTFVMGAVIAVIESSALAIGFGKNGLLTPYTWYMVLYATVVWTAGACFLIWLGQTITNKLIGNGISLILMFNILTTMPESLKAILAQFAEGKSWFIWIITIVIMVIVFALIFAYVVILNTAEKRIRISNSNKMGIRMGAANDNILPLKLNMGGVMPIIFSSSVMNLPVMIAQFAGIKEGSVAETIINCFNQGNWFNPETPIYTLGVLLFIPMTYFFSYFYSLISFNTTEVASNLRKSGSIINGIRPGQPTIDFLDHQIKALLWIGTTMLLFIALLPTVLSGILHINSLSFGGTTIIIIVSVILEMKNTLTAETSSVTYKSLTGRKRGK